MFPLETTEQTTPSQNWRRPSCAWGKHTLISWPPMFLCLKRNHQSCSLPRGKNNWGPPGATSDKMLHPVVKMYGGENGKRECLFSSSCFWLFYITFDFIQSDLQQMHSTMIKPTQQSNEYQRHTYFTVKLWINNGQDFEIRWIFGITWNRGRNRRRMDWKWTQHCRYTERCCVRQICRDFTNGNIGEWTTNWCLKWTSRG